MRPLRFLLSLATCVLAFFLLLLVGPWRASTEDDLEERSSVGAYFNWRAPSSLFPPSAIVSLTDDNSTFFLARPAAFGPLLPAKSLSGQLWVGSGFGDDRLGRSGPGAGAEGELGCSDIPDWNDGKYWGSVGSRKSASDAPAPGLGAEDVKSRKSKRSTLEEFGDDEGEGGEVSADDDGTDDHLHHPLSPSDGLKTNGGSAGTTKKPTHADIQSLQEGAEIAGKVVLLSRGGCGFLEKAKWVQRRGGVALIVGDDIRGGPLVTMYARGDTSNVTIPSLFTSHTTAHLLSSLIPSGGILDDLSAEDLARLGLALMDKESKQKKSKAEADKPNFTTTSMVMKATSGTKPQRKEDAHPAHSIPADDRTEREDSGWLKSLFSSRSSSGRVTDSRRPPSSGNIGWVLQEDFEAEEGEDDRATVKQTTTTPAAVANTKSIDVDLDDGFVIGVQDWRDPDLVAEQKERQQTATSSATASARPKSSNKVKVAGLKGGSITPGSGEYGEAKHEVVDLDTIGQDKHTFTTDKTSKPHDQKSGNWLTRLFHSSQPLSKDEVKTKKAKVAAPKSITHAPQTSTSNREHQLTGDLAHHDGLWVTLTPASMSSSPFFDTLLVLVVSPLVTLTIVYALLLLRSRIRRRRWRAPKSVVERLPVRTYQTMPSTTTSSSATSATSTPHISATTPLLPTDARPISTRSRPRSRTDPELPVQSGSSSRSDVLASASLESVEEKRAAGLAEWRRRYGGKQRECVVCLEEYVDGVSRVMSLPCGHEFHAECITPWLTTRRRTCPICKGDVVRSLAHASNPASASPPPPQYHDDEDEEAVQEQAAVTRNDDPSAALPVSREDEAFEDLELGVGADRTR